MVFYGSGPDYPCDIHSLLPVYLLPLYVCVPCAKASLIQGTAQIQYFATFKGVMRLWPPRMQ